MTQTTNPHPLAALRELGLTLKELQSAMKVVEKLRLQPELFEEDRVLQETRLWEFLTRPKHLKKKWRQVAHTVRKVRKKRTPRGNGHALMQCEMYRRKAADHNVAMGLRLIKPKPEPEPSTVEENPPVDLHKSQTCYVCSLKYKKLHHFYHKMCESCGNFNFTKRTQTRDLTGKVVIVTGARIKIGLQIVLKLLRDGATVVATTRFVSDAADRYKQEPDFDVWKARLNLVRLDLKCMASIREFCKVMLDTYGEGGVYALINNAAQTIARPVEYFSKLVEKEKELLRVAGCPDLLMLTFSGEEDKAEDPTRGSTHHTVVEQSENMYDTIQEYTDVRRKNTWTTRLHEVEFDELLDVFSVNSIAPFALVSYLTPVLKGTPTSRHHVVNVSAMEGVFYKPFKSMNHPHTNMAKASLNMMTQTAGPHYASEHNIIMNAIDTGWVTDENPRHRKLRNIARNLVAPLDEVDGASRVLDPIYEDTEVHSRFWKDYHVSLW